MVGRVPGLSPAIGNVYYLRMRPYCVRGLHNVFDLRTYESVAYPTFEAICLARGMLAGDGALDAAMAEADLEKMPYQLRALFACLLVHCDVPDPTFVLDRHYVAIAADETRRLTTRQAQGLDLYATDAGTRRYVLL